MRPERAVSVDASAIEQSAWMFWRQKGRGGTVKEFALAHGLDERAMARELERARAEGLLERSQPGFVRGVKVDRLWQPIGLREARIERRRTKLMRWMRDVAEGGIVCMSAENIAFEIDEDQDQIEDDLRALVKRAELRVEGKGARGATIYRVL